MLTPPRRTPPWQDRPAVPDVAAPWSPPGLRNRDGAGPWGLRKGTGGKLSKGLSFLNLACYRRAVTMPGQGLGGCCRRELCTELVGGGPARLVENSHLDAVHSASDHEPLGVQLGSLVVGGALSARLTVGSILSGMVSTMAGVNQGFPTIAA